VPDPHDAHKPPHPDTPADSFDDPGDEQSVVRTSEEPSAPDERVAELLESETATTEQLASAIEEQEAADAADVLEELDPEQSAAVLQEMEEESAAEALAHMDHHLAATVLADLESHEAAEFLLLMEPDDAVDTLQALPRDEAEQILRAMPAPRAATLGKLARYDPDSAGGLMTTDVPWLDASLSIPRAIDALRANTAFTEAEPPLPYVYCVDADNHLVGTLDVRRLLIARGEKTIDEIMDHEVDALSPTLDREDVAHEFERYDYIAMPVVDADRRLLGMVTIDDVIDIIRAEQTEDVMKQVGAGARESVRTTVRAKLAGRLPWLALNLLTSQLAAVTVLGFRDLIHHVEILAALMGVIANQAGNAGQQALAVTLRALVLDDIRPGKQFVVVAKEVAVGSISGILVGLLLLAAAALIGSLGLIPELNWRIGLVGAVAMTAALTVGCLVGSAVPIVIDRLGRDPATGSTIFLTMVTDTSSFLTFLGLASLLYKWIVHAPLPPG